jgi:type I restriction enzyme M protein
MDLNLQERELLDTLTVLIHQKFSLDMQNFIPQLSRWSDVKGFSIIPKWFRHVILNLLNPCMDETVLNLSMGTGSFLVDCVRHVFHTTTDDTADTSEKIRHYIHSKLYGTEGILELASIAKINILMNFGVNFSNIISVDMESNRKQMLAIPLPEADVIIMSSPVIFRVNIKIGQNIDSKLDLVTLSELETGLSSLRIGGRMATLVPEVFLRSEDTEGLRSYFLKRRFLKAIIALPIDLFKPFKKERLNLIIFERPDQDCTHIDPLILMADIRNIDVENCQSILGAFVERYHRREFEASTKGIFATSYSTLKRDWTVNANANHR